MDGCKCTSVCTVLVPFLCSFTQGVLHTTQKRNLNARKPCEWKKKKIKPLVLCKWFSFLILFMHTHTHAVGTWFYSMQNYHNFWTFFLLNRTIFNWFGTPLKLAHTSHTHKYIAIELIQRETAKKAQYITWHDAHRPQLKRNCQCFFHRLICFYEPNNNRKKATAQAKAKA